jgi:hypothetical protein
MQGEAQMLLTLRQGVALVILLSVAAGSGWLVGRHTNSQTESLLLSINESVPLVRADGRDITLADLDSESRMILERISSQFISQSYNLALRSAALRSLSKSEGVESRWRDVLATELSLQSLNKTYSEVASFKNSGTFASVFSEVERYVLEIERNKRVGQFVADRDFENNVTFLKHNGLRVELPFEVEQYPLIELGQSNGKKTKEIQVVFRYAGQLSQPLFTLIEKIALDNGYLIPVRLLPESTESEYDKVSIAEIFAARSAASLNQLTDLHRKLLKHSPALGDMDDATKVGKSVREIAIQNLSAEIAYPKNLSVVSEWFRDVRTAKTPLTFVAKGLVSDTHPRGFAYALLSALKP